MLNDTIVFNKNQIRSDNIEIEKSRKEEKLKEYGYISEGRIVYYIRFYDVLTNEYSTLQFKWDNWTSKEKIKSFHNFLENEYIEKIDIVYHNGNVIHIYGKNANFGVILFDIVDKEYFLKFRNLY